MPNYEKSVVYKIQHKTKPELVYVGATTNFNSRKNQHKSRLTNEKDVEHKCLKYEMIRNNGGWDMFDMVPVKEVKCESKLQLAIEEEKVRVELKANFQIRSHIERKIPAKIFLTLQKKKYTIDDLEE